MANEELAKTVLKRAEELTQEAVMFQDAWQQITDYMLPGRRTFQGTMVPGQRGTEKLFDGTAGTAANLLAASIHGSLSAPDTYWARLLAQDDAINDIHPCAMWLEDTTRRLHWHFAQSNLYAEIGETYLDDILYGTSNLYQEEKEPEAKQFSGFRFRAIPIGTFVCAEDANGLIDTVYRVRVELSSRAILKQWPSTCPDVIKDTAQTNPAQKYSLVHGVWPREGGKPNGFASQMPWASAWVESSTATVLEERGYNESPYHVARWWKSAGETYGRGPGWFALPDTKAINLAKELELTGWALAIRPPYKRLEHGVIGRVRFTPGGETLVRNMEDVQPITAIRTDWQASQVKSQEIVRSIQQIFFHDQLQLVENDRMTATEIEQRVALMQRFLGPSFGREQSEKHQPLVQRSFLMLYRRGALLPPPPEMSDYIKSGGALQIRYEGPLARAQRLSELQAIQKGLNVLLPMVQADPALASAMDNIDPDGLFDAVWDAVGASPKARKDKRQLAKEREAKAQMQAMQSQLDAASQVAQGANDAAPMVKALQPAPPGAQGGPA